MFPSETDLRAEVQALFGVAFLEAAEERGPQWYQRRLDRSLFRDVLDELRSLPRHGRDRRRYCQSIVADDATLAGAVCLFLLDPDAWNEAGLVAAMRPLPRPKRRTRKQNAEDERDGPGSEGESPKAPASEEAGATEDAGRRSIKTVKERRLLTRRRRRRTSPDGD